MKRQVLTLFLTVLVLMSVGGAVSIVGAASHENPGHASKQDVKAASCNFVASVNSKIYHYPWCQAVQNIKPENLRCYNTPCDAVAAGHPNPCKICNPPPC